VGGSGCNARCETISARRDPTNRWARTRAAAREFLLAARLKERIAGFIDYFNRTMAKPFKWTKTGKPLAA
jgi:hypothetical protein